MGPGNSGTGRVHIDGLQPRDHADALPLQDARHEQRRPAAVRIGDIDVPEPVLRLRPRAAVGAEAGCFSRADSARIKTIGNELRQHGSQQRRQIVAARQVREHVEGNTVLERGTSERV